MEAGWLESLEPDARARAEKLLHLLEECGAADAAGAVRADMGGDLPHAARFMMLRNLWPESIDCWRVDTAWVDDCIEEAEEDPACCFADAGAALNRLTHAGARPEDLASVARMVAYESVFHVLQVLDEGCDIVHEGEAPRWAVMEVGPDGKLTGRRIEGLHELLLSLDPSGHAGRPARGAS